MIEARGSRRAIVRAYEQRGSAWILHLKVDPVFDPLRDDPRFQDLLRRMNFPL